MSELGSHIGTLIKAHGYKGELQIKGKPALLDNIQIDDPLFISIDGQRIPFFVEDLFESGHPDRLIVKFEFIDDIDEARKYISCDVYFDQVHASTESPDMNISSMLGYAVNDKISGRSAKVTDFVASIENPILIITFGQQEVMLPLNADYIETIDHKSQTIIVSLPTGLIDL